MRDRQKDEEEKKTRRGGQCGKDDTPLARGIVLFKKVDAELDEDDVVDVDVEFDEEGCRRLTSPKTGSTPPRRGVKRNRMFRTGNRDREPFVSTYIV